MGPSQRLLNRIASDRWDVLETEIPRASCSVRGCDRSARYAHSGEWSTFWLCSRHLPRYREHDRMLRRIRDIVPR